MPVKNSSSVALSRDEILGLPAAVDIETAGRALGLKRSTAYALAKRGEFPVRTLRAGRSYRVVTAELLALLGITRDSGEGAGSAQSVG